jgi:hypothetical protein
MRNGHQFKADASFLCDLITANSVAFNTVAKYVEMFQYDGTDGHIIYVSKYRFDWFLRDGNHKAVAAYYLSMPIQAQKRDWKDMWSEEMIQEHVRNGKTIMQVQNELLAGRGVF